MDLKFNPNTEKKIVDYFSKLLPGQFIYPNRLASKVNTSNEKVAILIYKMVLCNLLEHVSVPMDVDTREIFESDFQKAILQKFSDDFVVYDQNQNEIPSSNLKPIAAFIKAQ